MAIAIGTDGTISITTILALTETAPLTDAPTGTGSLVTIGNALAITPGTMTETSIPNTTATGREKNGAVSGGGTLIPTAKGLRVVGSGKRNSG